MQSRIGLMGLGRIGRNIFRILYKSEDIRIEAVSDVADHAGLAYLLKLDTILGRFPDEVSARDGDLYVPGRQVKMLSAEDPRVLDWGDLGVEPVIEEAAEREGHLYVAGRQVEMVSAESPGEVNWGDLGVETVIEATAKFRTRAELERHLEMGAKRVILCTPPADPPDITVVMGVNEDQ